MWNWGYRCSEARLIRLHLFQSGHALALLTQLLRLIQQSQDFLSYACYIIGCVAEDIPPRLFIDVSLSLRLCHPWIQWFPLTHYPQPSLGVLHCAPLPTHMSRQLARTRPELFGQSQKACLQALALLPHPPLSFQFLFCVSLRASSAPNAGFFMPSFCLRLPLPPRRAPFPCLAWLSHFLVPTSSFPRVV